MTSVAPAQLQLSVPSAALWLVCAVSRHPVPCPLLAPGLRQARIKGHEGVCAAKKLKDWKKTAGGSLTAE